MAFTLALMAGMFTLKQSGLLGIRIEFFLGLKSLKSLLNSVCSFLKLNMIKKIRLIRLKSEGYVTPDKSFCKGCEDSPYWYGLGGQNKCWSFAGAKIVKRIPIGVDQSPPYDKKTVQNMMSCYHQKRMVYVSPEAIRDDGYWELADKYVGCITKLNTTNTR